MGRYGDRIFSAVMYGFQTFDMHYYDLGTELLILFIFQ